jgi:hypothetical protein
VLPPSFVQPTSAVLDSPTFANHRPDWASDGGVLPDDPGIRSVPRLAGTVAWESVAMMRLLSQSRRGVAGRVVAAPAGEDRGLDG